MTDEIYAKDETSFSLHQVLKCPRQTTPWPPPSIPRNATNAYISPPTTPDTPEHHNIAHIIRLIGLAAHTQAWLTAMSGLSCTAPWFVNIETLWILLPCRKCSPLRSLMNGSHLILHFFPHLPNIFAHMYLSDYCFKLWIIKLSRNSILGLLYEQWSIFN